MKPLIIYHGNCADGFAAAWAIWKLYPDWEFFPGKYQEPPPDVTRREVYLVDFSYKRAVIELMLDDCVSLTILDHHKSAIEDLSPLNGHPKLALEFDMNRSGAMIAWEYFHPDERPPPLLAHVQDRDLWQFKLPFTREIQAALFSYEYDFEIWDDLMMGPLGDLTQEGIAIERKHHKDIAELLAAYTRRMVIGGYDVPVCNVPYTMSSDAGHALAGGEAFGACYSDGPDGRYFSLRSTDQGVDVSEIAKLYGGGGHRNAAGFKVPRYHSLAME